MTLAFICERSGAKRRYGFRPTRAGGGLRKGLRRGWGARTAKRRRRAWRRGRDSNPRETCIPTRFPVVPVRPLRHLSLGEPTQSADGAAIRGQAFDGFGGESGIRTHGGGDPHNGFRDRRLKPLSHLSVTPIVAHLAGRALREGVGSRFRGQGGFCPVGSRLRGNDGVAGGQGGRGALRPAMALSRRLDSRLRGNDGTWDRFPLSRE